MRNYSWVILLFCSIDVPVLDADEAVPESPLTVNVGIESFRWEEFSDGQTQAGVPAKTDVDYLGINGEITRGVRMAGKSRVDLLVGLGADIWTRDLQDGIAVT